MPLIFTKDEIRELLAEMGYGDISDEDLVRFVTDLKKLIKIESKQRRRKRLGHTGETVSENSTSLQLTSNDDSRGDHNATQSRPSADSQPRLLFTPKSRQALRERNQTEDTSNSTSNPRSSTSEGGENSGRTPGSNSGADAPPAMENKPPVSSARPTVKSNRPQTASASVHAEGWDKKNEITGSSESSSTTFSDTDILCLMEQILKNEIKCCPTNAGDAEASKKKFEIPLKIRRDPVALYHWYKTFWDKQKPPGEDRHMQLRWNVRAGTIGRYPCDADGVPINYLRSTSARV